MCSLEKAPQVILIHLSTHPVGSTDLQASLENIIPPYGRLTFLQPAFPIHTHLKWELLGFHKCSAGDCLCIQVFQQKATE